MNWTRKMFPGRPLLNEVNERMVPCFALLNHSFFIGGIMECIDLISFLRNYYGITSSSLKINKLTHADIKILFPDIKRISLERLKKEMESIYRGEVLLVYDAHNYILPYVNPHYLVNQNIDNTINYDERMIIKIDDLELLSKDELLKLRYSVKKNMQYEDAKEITKHIREKKNPKVKLYKRQKRDLKMKMEDFYEKY